MSSSEEGSSSDRATSSIDSPPAAEQLHSGSTIDESRQRLTRLAGQLIRTQNQRLLAEFLTLRRSLR